MYIILQLFFNQDTPFSLYVNVVHETLSYRRLQILDFGLRKVSNISLNVDNVFVEYFSHSGTRLYKIETQ